MLTSGAAAGVAAGPDRRDSGGEAAGLSNEATGSPRSSLGDEVPHLLETSTENESSDI